MRFQTREPGCGGRAVNEQVEAAAVVPGEVIARIRSLVPSLLPAERAVAETLLGRPAEVIEMSSQQVADASGASRATVVRACQRLGYSGYQQLRVMLARDLGSTGAEPERATVDPQTAAEVVLASFGAVGSSIAAMTALLDPVELATVVRVLAGAGRIVVVGNGLSAPLAQHAAQRLVAIGRPADAPTDPLHQQIAAGQLGAGDALLVISGSGANETTVRSATAARSAGAATILVTAFARSALAALADHALVVGMREATFREELTVTTRIPQFIMIEALVAAVARELGPVAAEAHARTMAVIAENLAE